MKIRKNMLKIMKEISYIIIIFKKLKFHEVLKYHTKINVLDSKCFNFFIVHRNNFIMLLV